MTLAAVSRGLCRAIARLTFGAPVAYVYNPLEYARPPHERYLELYGRAPKKIVLLGMNPGPFGMAQTGVPFGDVTMVRQFLGVEGRVERPKNEHPKRPVLGFDCRRCEVSGSRLWGWVRERFGTAEAFFQDFFVINYCPLLFVEATGRNRTPDKLTPGEREPLFAACDRALRAVVDELRPEIVIGVGAFAQRRARLALPEFSGPIGTVLHPSPASPKANNGWSRIVESQLADLGIAIPSRASPVEKSRVPLRGPSTATSRS